MIRKRSLGSKLAEIFLVVLTFFTHWLIFYFVIVTACKDTADAAKLTLSLPENFRLMENLQFIFQYQHGALLKAFKNSLVITLVSVFFLVAAASATAVIMQRREGLLSRISNKLIVAGLIVPASVIPTYWMLNTLHVANTLAGLCLVEVATMFPFAVMLYKGYISSLPTEIDEAAVIDGCGSLTLYTRILFPLSKPITATVIILRSVLIYNDFENPQYYMSGSSTQTVQLFVYSLKSAWTTDYGHLFAAAIVVSLPLILLYIFLNRRILEGMTAGSVKG
ncbi:carbohydrate ABC transporter permease [bacterium D16-50]|jgi:raffinose/stachyose/melibiose transport system permease protein|nr:carbohydrate ABC transporter permease [Lachnospiraceae bacterium]RKJ18128.1 carbohydrate ABC transporter permease [bacterium D16-50]